MSLSEKLIAAGKIGNAREVRKLLGRGALFTKDKFGNTALHEAAWNGNNDVVKILLSKFCFVDSINHTGFTPLHLASQNGHSKVVKTLLKWKADPTLRNQHGETALHLVAKYNHANVISAFTAFRVILDIRGKDSNTALHIAAKLGNKETVKALLLAGADPNLTNSRGMLPLECAEMGGYKDTVKLLLSAQKPKVRQRASTTSHSEQTSRSRSRTPDTEGEVRSNRAGSGSAQFPFKPSKDVQKKRKNGLEDHMQVCVSPKERSLQGSRNELDGGCSQTSSSLDKNASIEQLLREIEREYYGPDYHYERRDSPSPQGDQSMKQPAKSYLRSTRDGQISKENYDFLEPPGPQDTYDVLVTPSSINGGDFKHHKYESLLPKEVLDDMDAYVYMAPCRDFQRSSSVPVEGASDSFQDTSSTSVSELSQGRARGTRRAVICSSPIELNAKHEPNTNMEPTKGILSQPSNESEQQSQLERYLQDELETMRQAFQIRLHQLEKRYQRQLVLEQKKHTGKAQQRRRNVNPLSPQQATGRRNSWHSYVSNTDNLVEEERRSQSSLGMESDCSIDESDIEPEEGLRRIQGPRGADERHNEVAEGLRGGNPTPKQKEGLKGGSRSWREEVESTRQSPRMSPVRGFEEDDSLTEEAKALIQEKTREYREKMTRYFKEKSEEKITVMERQYRAQMSEVERRCEERATEKLVRLENRIKDLEKLVEVQTLV